MRRRPRIDLGQVSSQKDEDRLSRKRHRWAQVNRDRPEDNPFIAAIKPECEQYGDAEENLTELHDRLAKLEFGNFPGYFNYRNKAASKQEASKTDDNQKAQAVIDNSGESTKDKADDNALSRFMADERLQYLDRKWFHGRCVLDIGCNRGHITYAIARLFEPKSILGIDIDANLIKMANRDLHVHLDDIVSQQLSVHEAQANDLNVKNAASERESKLFPLASYISDGPIIALDETKSDIRDNKNSDSPQFPNNILFIEHNYVLSKDELVDKQKPHFDTIVCLSVTKWIHLNYRDEGLKRFFKRIYKHLNPNGIFVLESQPFDNYARRKKLSDRVRKNYYSIQFKPENFDAFLLGPEVGFREIIFDSVTSHECAGFKRPFKVYLK